MSVIVGSFGSAGSAETQDGRRCRRLQVTCVSLDTSVPGVPSRRLHVPSGPGLVCFDRVAERACRQVFDAPADGG
jgi:hypothetical protein